MQNTGVTFVLKILHKTLGGKEQNRQSREILVGQTLQTFDPEHKATDGGCTEEGGCTPQEPGEQQRVRMRRGLRGVAADPESSTAMGSL